mmetsp:Transcript_6999/g.11050  ORF Transcript_6999/g.11050 Transcript_6999/m.11050 type:complete len:227 (+) Transcript_6999:72-752(+)
MVLDAALLLKSMSIAEWIYRLVQGRKEIPSYNANEIWSDIMEGRLLYVLLARLNPSTRKKNQLDMPEAYQGQFLEDCQNMGISTGHIKASQFTSRTLDDRRVIVALLESLALQAYVTNSVALPWHMQREQEFESEKRRQERETAVQKNSVVEKKWPLEEEGGEHVEMQETIERRVSKLAATANQKVVQLRLPASSSSVSSSSSSSCSSCEILFATLDSLSSSSSSQ